MIKRTGLIILLLSGFLLAPRPSAAQDIYVEPDGDFEQKTLSVPYAFYNDSFGAAVGYVYGKIGYPQKQASLLGTVMAGTQGSVMGFLIGRDLHPLATGTTPGGTRGPGSGSPGPRYNSDG